MYSDTRSIALDSECTNPTSTHITVLWEESTGNIFISDKTRCHSEPMNACRRRPNDATLSAHGWHLA